MTRYRPTAHRPYIEHVHDALSRAEFRVAFPYTSSTLEVRGACLNLDSSGTYGSHAPCDTDLLWSELDGWRLEDVPRGPVTDYLDLPILATPGEVADMVRDVLAGTTAALPAPCKVRALAEDPLFEAELDRYTVTLGRRAEPSEGA